MSLASYHCSTPGRVSLGRRRPPLAAAVPLEEPGRRELPELVTHHVLGHVQPGELPAVVHEERLADELRYDRAIPRPGLERLAGAGALLPLHLGQQPLIDVGAFLQRPAHDGDPFRSKVFYNSGERRLEPRAYFVA